MKYTLALVVAATAVAAARAEWLDRAPEGESSAVVAVADGSKVRMDVLAENRFRTPATEFAVVK